MIDAISWLAGSKTGRIVASVGLTLTIAGLVVMQAFRRGVAAQKLRQQAAQMKALKARVEVEDEIAKLSPDRRREHLARWMRDDK